MSSLPQSFSSDPSGQSGILSHLRARARQRVEPEPHENWELVQPIYINIHCEDIIQSKALQHVCIVLVVYEMGAGAAYIHKYTLSGYYMYSLKHYSMYSKLYCLSCL